MGSSTIALTVPFFHDADAALRRADRGDGGLHVALVGAGDDEVVRIVPDAAGHRPVLQSEILQKPARDRARLPVPLQHRHETKSLRQHLRRPCFNGSRRLNLNAVMVKQNAPAARCG